MTHVDQETDLVTDQSEPTPDDAFLGELARELKDLWAEIRFILAGIGPALRNLSRQTRGVALDFVVLPIGGPLPERSGPRRGFIRRQLPLPPQPMSMGLLNVRMKLVADASNVKGVVLIFKGFATGFATLQSLRRSIERLQKARKQVIVFTPYLDLGHVYVASAADRIIVPPSTRFDAVGLHSEVIFLKDALAKIGIEAEVIQVSAYKDAYNMFDRSEISDEQAEQINWLLDEIYDLVIDGIAAGRNMAAADVKQWVDSAPMSPQKALEAGLIDDLAYEDNLPYLLAETDRQSDKVEADPAVESDSNSQNNSDRKKANLALWPQAGSMLLEKRRRSVSRYIGVVSVEGELVMGPSRRPPLETPIPLPFVRGAASGEQSVTRLLRQVEKDEHMAALILHVNSPGGSPLASDLIWRQLSRIARKKPVLAYLGNAAASGGYYIAAGASHIVSQSLTITGSIGVVTAHFNTAGLFKKAGINRVDFNRGARAALHSDMKPLSEDERHILWSGLTDTYDQFKTVVAKGRKMEVESLDPVCGGRVWTGRQALKHKLVDSLGDFEDAVLEASRLAGLPVDDEHQVSVINLHPPDSGHILPTSLLPEETLVELFSLSDLLRNPGKPHLLMPFAMVLH